MSFTDPDWMFRRGPYSRGGSVINVVMSGFLLVGGSATAIASGQVPVLFIVMFIAIGVVLFVNFIRIARRAHRGDYDDYSGMRGGRFGPRG